MCDKFYGAEYRTDCGPEFRPKIGPQRRPELQPKFKAHSRPYFELKLGSDHYPEWEDRCIFKCRAQFGFEFYPDYEPGNGGDWCGERSINNSLGNLPFIPNHVITVTKDTKDTAMTKKKLFEAYSLALELYMAPRDLALETPIKMRISRSWH